MVRNTVVCILAFLAFGKGVLLAESATSSPHQVASSSVGLLSSSAIPSASPSATPSASSSAIPSASPSATPSASSSAIPSASPSATPSAIPSASPSAIPSASPSARETSQTLSHGISNTHVMPSASLTPTTVQSSSASISASASATPILSSAMMSSSLVVKSSSLVPVITTSAASFINPSRTAVVVSETIHIEDKKRNMTCLSALLEVDFMIYYNATIKNATKQENTTIPLNGYGPTIHVTGNCSFSEGNAYFQIRWNEEGLPKPLHTFKMTFNLAEDGKWNVPEVNAVFQTSDSRFQGLDEGNITATINGSSMFGFIENGTNYVCNGGEKLVMSDEITAMFTTVNLQPFSSDEKIKKDGVHCAADHHDDDDDDDNNTVPIAVGAALGGLVLIVLVAYVVGRRRSNRGYEQV